MDIAAFFEDVYAVVSEIPPGKVISYGDIALLLGQPGHSRLVGRALREVPTEKDIPCHRVVNAQGRLAPGWVGQRLLLEEEGIGFRPNGVVDLKKFRWNWREVY